MLAHELDIAIVGPNGQGFANIIDRAPGWTAFAPDPVLAGPIGLIGQSGSLTLTIADFAAKHSIGLSHMIGTGNEVNLDMLDFLECLIEDERVRVVAVFAESIRDGAFFRALADRAAALDKAIVMLKVGASPLAAQLALTHTGALVGDDDVVSQALTQSGVIRVPTLEQLMFTSALIAHTGPLPAGGLGVVSMSGGVNDIVADRAAALGVPLPGFSPATRKRIGRYLATFATVQNPMDLTGGASLLRDHQVEPALAIGADPGVALVAYTGIPLAPERPSPVTEYYGWIAEGLRAVGTRGILILNTVQSVNAAQRALLDAAGVPHTVPGVEYGLHATADAMRWSAWLRRTRSRGPARGSAPGPRPDGATGVWSETQALGLLSASGVNVVPWQLARSAGEAAAGAARIGYPVVVKLAAPDVLHKSDIGGVVLGLDSADAVRAAYDQVTGAGTAAGARVEGVVVAAMRTGGAELLAGVIRDPDWGLVLAVGIGGVQAEVWADRSLRLLPVSAADVRDMLGELRGAALLRGFRGSAPVDTGRLTGVIVQFARLAESLGPALVSMEINPLLARGDRVEALDAAVTWAAIEASG